MALKLVESAEPVGRRTCCADTVGPLLKAIFFEGDILVIKAALAQRPLAA